MSEAPGLPAPTPTEDASTAAVLTPRFGVPEGIKGILFEHDCTTGTAGRAELIDVSGGDVVYDGGYEYGKPCKIPRALFPLLVVPKLSAPYTVEMPF